MNQTSFFYKDRMHWLSEIQIFRKRLDEIKTEVKEIDVNNGKPQDAEIKSFSETVKSIDGNLDITEKKLLFSLNNGKIYWTDANNNSSDYSGNRNDKDDLFDRMKNGYTLLIELQRSINNYLQKMIITQ